MTQCYSCQLPYIVIDLVFEKIPLSKIMQQQKRMIIKLNPRTKHHSRDCSTNLETLILPFYAGRKATN